MDAGLCSTPSYRALSHTFSFEADDDALVEYLASIWEPLRIDGGGGRRYRLVRSGERWEVSFDGEVLSSYSSPDGALAYLLWHVNRQVIDHERERLLLHASAAEWEGACVLMPAVAESGKTTLVAGLVRSGLRYVTDEAVAIDLTSLEVAPYPKPLSVDPGSWPVLADLRPQVPPAMERYLKRQWHVVPTAVHADAIAGPSLPRLIVSPRYQPGEATRLEPLRRSEALLLLTENAFNMVGFGRTGFLALSEVARRCDAYRLVMSDLDDAVRLVRDRLGV